MAEHGDGTRPSLAEILPQLAGGRRRGRHPYDGMTGGRNSVGVGADGVGLARSAGTDYCDYSAGKLCQMPDRVDLTLH
jgi:hypothetical protein